MCSACTYLHTDSPTDTCLANTAALAAVGGISTRCSKLASGRVVLVGDAAHSVWPTLGHGELLVLLLGVCTRAEPRGIRDRAAEVHLLGTMRAEFFPAQVL